MDCFIHVNFAGERNQTKTIKNNYSPVWNTELRLPVYIPTMSDRITVRTMDYERIGANKPIATMAFKWSSIVYDQFGPAWVNTCVIF